MKIIAFASDPGGHRFIQPILDKWEKQGIETALLTNYGPQEADIYWFDFVDNNLISASRDNKEDLKSKRVIARLHAVEYYVGHYKNVDWSVVDDLIFVSEHMRRKVGKLPVKTHVVPNGIDLEKLTFKEKTNGHNIGYAGSIVPCKGILLMFHYFKQLLNRDPRFKLFMVGLNRFHGREGEYYKHYLNIAGLKNEIIPKVIEGNEVQDINKWLDNMDYLWQPSLAESFSLIVGEAMAKGIKPLINNFSGSTEIWPQDLIYRDFDEFYKLVTGRYNSKLYRNFVDRYSLDNQVKKLNEIIQI